MASEPAGVSGPVPTGEATSPLSPDSDSVAAARSGRADRERVTRKNQEDFESLKRCNARELWRKREEETPSGRMTWGEWFTQKFGETLEQYAERLKQERKNG